MPTTAPGCKNVTLMVQIPSNWDRDSPVHRHGDVVRLARRLRRDRHGGRMGSEARLRGRRTPTRVRAWACTTSRPTPSTCSRGTRATAAAAGKGSNFTSLTGSALTSFNAAHPNRIAVKHAHSQQNPEKDWGTDTLNAVRFAIYALNEEKGDKNPDGTTRRPYTADNTIVIASSVSNGGGAALAAAEQDTDNLIDGVAVGEPSVALVANTDLRVTRGATTLVGTGRPLYDYFTLANLLQPCAALSTRAAGSPGAAFVPAALATNRCTALKTFGVLTTTTTAAQAEEALDLLLAAGWEPATSTLQASHYAFATLPVAMAYANAYGRFSVADNLCGYSYAGVDAAGKPAPLAAAALAQVFGTGNGVPPMSGMQIINNLSPGGPIRDAASLSPSTGQLDFNVDGARLPAQPVDRQRPERDAREVRRRRDPAHRRTSAASRRSSCTDAPTRWFRRRSRPGRTSG